jgi:hypothetical protein
MYNEYIFITKTKGGDNMPGFDKTGPLGNGPQTGRGLGPCGCGMRRGAGRGYGRGFNAMPVELSAQDERKILEAEITQLEAEKQAIEKKLKETK